MPNNVLGSLGGSSLLVRGAQASFNVDVESDVIALLKLIHQNPLNGKVKNHLRDLIFTYRQEQDDVSYDALLKKCSELGIALSRAEKKGATGTSATTGQRFAQTRPQPSFATVVTNKKSTSEETKGNTVPIRKVSEETKASSVPQQPIPVPTIASVPEVKVEVKTEVPPPPTTYTRSTATVQERIAQIKSAVNQKAGNPVNLIAKNEVLGRKYMNALLTAMKKANGAPSGELEVAMGELESAFSEVMDVLEGKVVATGEVQSEVQAVEKEVAPSEQPLSEPEAEKSEEQKNASPEERTKMLEERLAELKKKVVIERQKEAVRNKALGRVETPRVVVPKVEIKKPLEVPKIVEKREEGLRSVAKNKQLQDLLRTNREKDIEVEEKKEKEAIEKMDPFMTPEVSAGLAQLLSEWTLFKSSGFFGTGPSGREHALYQKLRGLTMATVIAGRFEGSTPLIKQSIADYMNGWRYEEGIIHEHGETFEHYLRKVVHHIIEKKKNARIQK